MSGAFNAGMVDRCTTCSLRTRALPVRLADPLSGLLVGRRAAAATPAAAAQGRPGAAEEFEALLAAAWAGTLLPPHTPRFSDRASFVRQPLGPDLRYGPPMVPGYGGIHRFKGGACVVVLRR